MIVLEDCHWLDPLSRDLLDELVRVEHGLPSCSSSPTARRRPGGRTRLLGGLPGTCAELRLEELGGRGGRGGAGRQGRASGRRRRRVPPALADLVAERAQGNPFYIEELLNYVHGRACDLRRRSAPRARAARTACHSLVLGRIDMLAEGPRRTLKVASVVGRSFARALAGRLPGARRVDDVRERLGEPGLDLVVPDRIAERSWLFRQAVARGRRLREPAVRPPRPPARRVAEHPRVLRPGGGRARPRPAGAPLVARRRRGAESVITSFAPACCAGALCERGGRRLVDAPRALVDDAGADRRPPPARQGARARRRVERRRRRRSARRSSSRRGTATTARRAGPAAPTSPRCTASRVTSTRPATSSSAPRCFERLDDQAGRRSRPAPRGHPRLPAGAVRRGPRAGTRRAWRSVRPR